ncbi:MAG: zinc ribbon domain-containing protein [Anaerolineae bacterium]|nr:zinc ribbon domain-containing protein [Anaerolineae bacterium]
MINESVFIALGVYGGVILLALWLALVTWAYRDMRARSRDRLAQFFVAISVAVLNVFGVFIYVLLRPRETLSEAYERSLEEEALLQEIEEKPSCPGCSQRVREEWQVCPNCHTRLKKPCHVCGHLLELPWTICPHCAAAQNRYLPEDSVVNASRHIERSAPRTPRRSSATAGGELPLSSSSPQILDEN